VKRLGARQLGSVAVAATMAAVIAPSSRLEVAQGASGFLPAVSPRATPLTVPLITTVSGEGLGILVDWTPASATAKTVRYLLVAKSDIPAGRAVSSSCKLTRRTAVPGNDTMAVLPNVCARVAYRVTVQALNAAGKGPVSRPSDPVVASTATAPSIPLVESVLARGRSLVVSWAPPSYDGGKKFRSYRLTASARGSTRSVTVGAQGTVATISRLTNGVRYALSLRAVNGAGRSLASTSSGRPEPSRVPGAPVNLSAVPSAGSGSVAASWSAPLDNGGLPIRSYRLAYLKEVASTAKGGRIQYRPAPGSHPVAETVHGTAVTVTKLSTGKVFYVFRVSATNARGRSRSTPYSEPITLATSIRKSAHALKGPALAGLSSFVNGTLTWRYASEGAVPAAVKSITAGQVLVAAPSAAAPDGFLARVTAVSHPGSGVYVVTTVPARLSDAFSTLTAQVSAGAGPAGASRRQAPKTLPGHRRGALDDKHPRQLAALSNLKPCELRTQTPKSEPRTRNTEHRNSELGTPTSDLRPPNVEL
jgi:Fibronectin type III domain